MRKTKHFLLMAAMLLGSVGASADNIASGICGNNLTWELTDTGELIVGGTGAMGNYTHSYGSYAPWNEYRNSIKTVTILEGVTTIGERAFWSCIYLTSITISESVTSIGYGAFMGCSRLPSIDIPDGVTSIGSYAFEDCTGLTTIIIPNGVTSTGGGTFQGCSSLTSVTISEKMTVIGEYTFYGCSSLTSIKIPDAVARIEMYAFNDCSSLAIVTIGKGVTSVNGSSFQKGCNKIHTVINYSSLAISKGSTDCGYVAYYAHKVLDMDELENLGGFLFYTKNDIHYLAGYIGEEKQIVFPESYKESNYQIASYAFEDFSSLSSITIPESVTSIGGYAFYGCSSLTSITCHATVPPTIGNSNTFYNVDKFIPVYVPASSVSAYQTANGWQEFTNIQPIVSVVASGTCGDNLTWELTDAGELIIEGAGDMYDYSSRSDVPWYEYRESIKTITILGGVTGIGDHAFDGCRRFTSVALPESVTKMGQRAFHGCRSLTSITISRNVVSIGDAAFTDCDGLTTLVVEDGNQVYDSRSGCNAIIETSTNTLIAGCGTTVIPESVTGIGVRAFQSCSSLTSITIPRNVVSIGDVAFTFCDGLTTLVVEEGNQVYDSRSGCNAIIETNINTLIAGCSTTVIPDGVTAIGAYAFYGCETLTSITVPEGVTVLGDFAFQFCEALEQLSLPSTLEHIGWAAISHCEVLGEIALPSNVRTIDSYAFDYTGMTSITIPEGVDKIAYAMFSNCSNLASIVIPGSVSLIEEHALEECSELTAIICNATTPPTVESANTFTNVPRSIPVYVPASSVEAYKAADYWNEFANIIGTDEDGNIVVEDAWESYANAEAKKNNGIAYTRNFRNTNWQALYVPFEIPVTEELLVDFDVACIHDVYQNDNNADGVGEETIVEVRKVKSGTLDANYPYLIRAKEEGEKTITMAEAMLYATQETSIEYSLAFGTYTFTGTYSRLSAAELAGCYALSSGILQPIADGASLGAFRFYMKIESRDGNAQAARNIRMRVVDDDDATGMEMTSDDRAQTTVVYDLQGRRVANPTKGIYIVNGKKRLF